MFRTTSWLWKQLQPLRLQSAVGRLPNKTYFAVAELSPRAIRSVRWLTSRKDIGEFEEDDSNNVGTINEADDAFGVSYEDGEDNMGPSSGYPPRYKRDAATGRQTGEVEREISDKDRRILSMNEAQQDQLLLNQMLKDWDDKGDQWLSNMGRQVREAQMGLNVLGRSVEAQAAQDLREDQDKRPTGFSQRLTRSEFEGFRQYMRKHHKQDISLDDFPVMDDRDTGKGARPSKSSTDSPDLANKWTSNLAQRQMDPNLDDDPYSDLLPADLNVNKLVNRKEAKRIPKELLHHNNVSLLRYFLTPTGQIKHRIQTRLGARDQRKIAKLIRRARHMGLLPYQNQFATEQHGWIHAPDIGQKREWEEALERRGLVVQKPPVPDVIPEIFR